MQNMSLFQDNNKLPFIIVSNNTAIKVSLQFALMTKYNCEELVNKNVKEVFNILKIGAQIDNENIDEDADYFLFDKFNEVILVNIKLIQERHEKIYIFSEKPDSNLNTKFVFVHGLLTDNYHGIAVYSMPDATLLKANEKYFRFLGEPYNLKGNFIGRRASEFKAGLIDNDELYKLDKLIAAGKTYNVEEYMNNRSEKGITYWKITITPIFEDDKLKYCIQMLTEITDQVLYRKKMEEQTEYIKKQSKQLEAIVDSISEELYIVDKDRNYIWLNKQARERYNFSEIDNSKTYMSKFDLFDISGNPIDFNNTQTARLTRGETIKDEIIIVKDPDKRYICINAKPVFDEKGDFYIGVLAVQDITAKILQEDMIKHKNDQLQVIINSMSDGLELVDNNMQITFLNQSAMDFFYNPGTRDVKGNGPQYSKYYYGIDGEEISCNDLPIFKPFLRDNCQNYILTIERLDKRIYASINGGPIYDDNNEVKEAILCIRDITEQVMQDKAIKYHQEAAIRAECERNELLEQTIAMKDEFLSIISHELRTPLNVINTAIQGIEFMCDKELSSKAKAYIKIIRQNIYRQLRLVNNLLDITRVDAGRLSIHKRNMDIVFLSRSITESVYSYAKQKGVSLTFESSIRQRIIGIDEEKYERILLNLLSNAIKFTPGGKSIDVKLSTLKDKVCIRIKDTGIGIPKNKIDLIFERFGQVDSSLSRQAEGAGIGLSLVKRLVEALNGSITVKSKVGEGSSFKILLPNVKVTEDDNDQQVIEKIDNQLIQFASVEFSDIYL